MENIPEDVWTAPGITVMPYFDNVIDADALGCEIGWPDHEPQRAIQTIKNADEMEAWQIPVTLIPQMTRIQFPASGFPSYELASGQVVTECSEDRAIVQNRRIEVTAIEAFCPSVSLYVCEVIKDIEMFHFPR